MTYFLDLPVLEYYILRYYYILRFPRDIKDMPVQQVIKARKELQHPMVALFPPEFPVMKVIQESKAKKVLKDYQDEKVSMVYRDIQGTGVTPDSV
jgi:hypothetical protein